NNTPIKCGHGMLTRCKYGCTSFHVLPRRRTLKLPSFSIALRSVPVTCCVSPGSNVGFCILSIVGYSRRMKRLLSVLVAFPALLTFAQDKLPPKGRTSPTGYTDTPLIPGQKWRVHDIERPRPRVVTPSARPGGPPSDAIVLF